MILFVQPFGLGTPGGGSRILRALLKDAPQPWLSVATGSNQPPPSPLGSELHLRCRPYFGRLERSRFAHWPKYMDGQAISRLESRLDNVVRQRGIKAIHAIAHECWDTLAAFRVAQQHQLPFYLTVHDDPAYCLKGHPLKEKFLTGLPECWNQAKGRFVISEEMGQELCRRWGKKDYLLVTDGLEKFAPAPRPIVPNRLAVYFMGLFLLPYEPNLVALQRALKLFQEQNPRYEVSLTLRCGGVRRHALVHPRLVKILPFGSEKEAESDMENADILYQPLSLELSDRHFTAFSLSTKMITYLGTGLPILFHGPTNSAAGSLLRRHRAAFMCATNNVKTLAALLLEIGSAKRGQVVTSALALAQSQFHLEAVRRRFWQALTSR